MPDVTVPAQPVLKTIKSVQIAQSGTWPTSTGVFTFTPADFAEAVAALDCPAVRRPILKLGHVDPRFDGEPAVGFVANLRTDAEGTSLVGDFTSLPAWLADVAASAYPDRSIEGEYRHVCTLGHTHPFVITAVAFLGVSAPAVGTLTSLQDVGALYGIAAATETAPTGHPFRVTATGGNMPAAAIVAASVSAEDVRRAYYAGPGQNFDWWIQQIYVDPPELIVCNDGDGDIYRVVYQVGAGEGADAVTFSDPVEVVVQYVDAPKQQVTAAAVFASRDQSRPKAPAAASASGSTPEAQSQEGNMPSFTDAQVTTLRQRLGIADENADGDAILAALEEALAERADPQGTGTPPAPPAAETPPAVVPVAASHGNLPAGAIVLDSSALEALRASAKRGEAAFARMAQEDRDRAIDDAVTRGKIAAARRPHWQTAWDKDPDGTKQALASMPANLIPVKDVGYAGDDSDGPDEYAHIFPPKGA